MWPAILIILIAFVFSLFYFGDNLSSTELPQNGNIDNAVNFRKPRNYSVFYKAGVFSPTNLRVVAGDTVTFENNSLAQIRITSDENSKGELILDGFDSINIIKPGDSFAYKFSEEGIFGYHNFSNDLERGVVIVRSYSTN